MGLGEDHITAASVRSWIPRGHDRQGVNYGIGLYPSNKLDNDLSFLRKHFDYIRIAYPRYDSSAIEYWQNMCVKAKDKGFDVMWGITCPSDGNWPDFIAKFKELVPWAVKHNINYGVNEEMYHNNDAVISDSQILASLQTTALAIKKRFPFLRLHMSVAGDGELDKVSSLGAFDFIGLNQYGTLADHKQNIDKLIDRYKEHGIVTEFSTGRGFDPAFGDEASWKADIAARIKYMKSRDVQNYYLYTYDYNPS